MYSDFKMVNIFKGDRPAEVEPQAVAADGLAHTLIKG